MTPSTVEVGPAGGNGMDGLNKNGKDKAAHCVEMLVAGYPQAFVEFFETTNGSASKGKDGAAALGGDKFSDNGAVEMPEASGKDHDIYSEEVLTLLQRSFVAVEEARRAFDAAAIYESYFKVATFFLENDSPEYSIPFYTRCVKVAEDDDNKQGLMKSHFQLGFCYTQLENTPQAIEHHERHLELALQLDDTTEEEKAYEYVQSLLSLPLPSLCLSPLSHFR